MLLALAIFTRFPHGLPNAHVGDITILVACALGTVGALAIRRNGAAYVLGGFVAMMAVELSFHLRFGFRTVRGGPAHFADIAAGVLGVTFAALAESRAGSAVNKPVWGVQAVGESALRAGLTVRQALGYWANAVFGLVAFVMSELSIRVVYGWIFYVEGRGWRWHHFFFDSKTNYAILLCALLGAVLGMAVGRWGDFLAIPAIGRRRAVERASM